MMNSAEPIGDVFHALADPTRREVIARLGAGPASTSELAGAFDMALPSFMQHLSVLEGSGLIASTKVGRVRTWHIRQDELALVEAWIREQRAGWEARADQLTEFVEAMEREGDSLTAIQYDFTVSRLIKARRRTLWNAWMDPALLARWWTPAPLVCTVISFDGRQGGAFEISMRSPDGQQMSQEGAFLEIVPQERIVFTTALTAGYRPAPTWLPITAVILMADETGGTRYETKILYKNEEDRQKLEGMHFEAGWSLGIDQLEALAAELDR